MVKGNRTDITTNATQKLFFLYEKVAHKKGNSHFSPDYYMKQTTKTAQLWEKKSTSDHLAFWNKLFRTSLVKMKLWKRRFYLSAYIKDLLTGKGPWGGHNPDFEFFWGGAILT